MWRAPQGRAIAGQGRASGSDYKSFEERIGNLTAFKEKHGLLCVTDKHDRSLASLCTRMRSARRNPNTTVGMTEERMNQGAGWSGV